jgi:hypothetical protein
MNTKVLVKIMDGVEEKLDVRFDYHHPDFQKFVLYVREQYDFMKRVIPSKYSKYLIDETVNRIALQLLMGLSPFMIPNVEEKVE